MIKTKSVIIAFVVVAAVSIIGLISARYLGNDNIVEEQMEKIIKAETGADVDLTPLSAETQTQAG